MNQNLVILDEDHNPDAHDKQLPENRGEGDIRRQPPAPRPEEYYKGYDNIIDSEGPLFLPPLPRGHTFVETSSLMQMLTARGLFFGIPSEDPHAHITKVRSVCTSCVGKPDLNMDVIGLRVSPLSLTGEFVIWFTELPYNSMYTLN